MPGITKQVQDATYLLLSNAGAGFNVTMNAVSGSYGVQPITINWQPGGPNYFPANMRPEDLEESSPSHYPMVFLYGVQSRNTHESRGRKFAGPVQLFLDIWVTNKSSAASKAAMALDVLISALEETCNDLFTNGNWPQGYGATNAVMAGPTFTRGRLDQDGEEWRQSLRVNLLFTLDTN